MWLSWDMGALLAVCLAGTGAATKRLTERRWAAIADFLVEASIVASLYAVWQLITTVVNTGAVGAIAHGRWVLDVEQWMHLPSELSWQHAILGQKLLVEASNGFYAIVHVPALGVFLVWLFLRHRDQYPEIRNALAILTLACFVIHLIPVAPPRLIGGTGFIDTGLQYHQSVYGPVGTGISDQVSAMPSVHIAWAALIAWGAIKASTSQWRWLVALHLLLSMIVVVVTANHFWLDGLVAIALLVPSVYAGRALRRLVIGSKPASTLVSRRGARRDLLLTGSVLSEPTNRGMLSAARPPNVPQNGMLDSGVRRRLAVVERVERPERPEVDMTAVPLFYTNSAQYAPAVRDPYHETAECQYGQQIRSEDRLPGHGNRSRCEECQRL